MSDWRAQYAHEQSQPKGFFNLPAARPETPEEIAAKHAGSWARAQIRDGRNVPSSEYMGW